MALFAVIAPTGNVRNGCITAALIFAQTLIDSALGSLIQVKYYDEKCKIITEKKIINNVENKQIEKDEISAEDGILPAFNNMTNTISEDDTQAISGGIGQGDGENFSGSENKNSGSGSGGTIEGMAGGDNEKANGRANVTEDRYSVASRFAQAVENHKSYPYASVRLNQQGTVIINVTIDASGNLISAGVVSSVNGNLDKAALNAVYSACPFGHSLGESISMNVPVNFYLN